MRFITKIKTDLANVPQSAWWVLVSISIYSFGVGFFDPFFSVYLHSFFGSYGEVGLYISFFTLASALLAIPVGYLVDRAYYRTVLVIGRLLVAVALLMYFFAGATGNNTLLIAGLITQGVAFPFVWTGTESALRFATGKKGSTVLFGLYGTLASLASLAAVLIALHVFIDVYALYVLFLPAAVLALVSITPIVRIEREIGHVPLVQAIREWVYDHQLGRHYLEDIREFNSEMWVMLLIGCFDKFIQVGFLAFVPLYIIDATRADLSAVGYLTILVHLPVLMSIFFAEVAKRGERLLYIAGGLSLSALAALFVSYVPHIGVTYLYAATVVAILGLVIAGPSIAGTTTNLAPRGDFGTVTAVQTLLRRIGATIAPIAVGYSIDAVGFRGTFAWIAGVTFLMVIVVIILRYVWAHANTVAKMNKSREHETPFYL